MAHRTQSGNITTHWKVYGIQCRRPDRARNARRNEHVRPVKISDIQSEFFYSFVRPRLERTSSDNGRKPESIATAILVRSLHAHDNHHLDSSGDTTTREHAASAAKHIASSIVAELSNGAHSTKEEGPISPSVMRRFCANTCPSPFSSYKS